MNPFTNRALIAGVLTVLGTAAAAAAQTTPAVLNAVEVRKLVASDTPADHGRLAGHFTALADRHEAEAKRHTTMARAFAGNPNRRVSGMNEHCTRLAALNSASAVTLRELAKHHTSAAAGTASPLPKGAARFEAGAGAPEPTEAELKALAATAATPADHRALEEYFRAAATRYTDDATNHAALAQTYRGTRIAHAAAHCDRLVATARDAAKEARAAAEMHAQLATIAK